MDHQRHIDAAAVTEAAQLDEAFAPESLCTEEGLMKAIALQPQHPFLWRSLLQLGKPELLDIATLGHTKNYTAWAVRRRQDLDIQQDVTSLLIILKLDHRNLRTNNHIITQVSGHSKNHGLQQATHGEFLNDCGLRLKLGMTGS